MNKNLEKLKLTASSKEITDIQNKQLSKLFEAKGKIENGELNDGIRIIEEITYKEGGLIFNGVTWPMYLAKIYLKHKMYDECWKYLNFISMIHIDCLDKIREMQSKISYIENRPKDSVSLMVISLIYRNTGYDVSYEELSEHLVPLLRKTKMENIKQELITYISKYCANHEILEENKIISDIKSIIM